jgi:hypothetical protein
LGAWFPTFWIYGRLTGETWVMVARTQFIIIIVVHICLWHDVCYFSRQNFGMGDYMRVHA